MAVLTYAGIVEEIEDALVVNVTIDAPLAAAEVLRAINSAYAQVWEISGGRVKTVPDATAWNASVTAKGTVFGLLSDIREPLNVFVTATAPQALTTVTNSTTTLTSAALFGSVTIGMLITGTGIPAGTYVVAIASTSSLTMSQAATDSTSNSRTFSELGETPGTGDMYIRDLAYIQWLKKSDITGTYAMPKVCAVTPLEPQSPAAATTATTGLMRLDYWPPVAGFYFPMSYIPQFTPLDAGATDTPTVNDLESYDIAWIAAADLAPRFGKAELVPGLLLKVSAGTRAALERKLKAMTAADPKP